MKTFFVLLITLILTNLAIGEETYSASDLEEWNTYKITYGRNYGPAEDARRLKIFMDHKNLVAEHNAKHAAGLVSFTIGINQFSDRFPEERPHSGIRSPAKSE